MLLRHWPLAASTPLPPPAPAQAAGPLVPGTGHLTAQAIAGAIRAAFSRPGGPHLRGIRLERQAGTWRAVLRLEGGHLTPEARRRWVEEEYFLRWRELEKLLGIALQLRRQWGR